MSWDNVTGTFKEKGKIFSVPMPQKPEGLRARLRTLGVFWHFLRLRHPGRREPRTAEVSVLDRHVDWLCGPDVWGLATEDANGKPISTPTIDHVLILDMAIRKRVAELMNEGKDLRAAYGEATEDNRIMQIHFLNHVAIDIGTAKCRALTAPGIAEAHAATAGPPTGGAKRALEDDDGTLSKAQLDRIKKKAKAEAKAAARAQLAVLDRTRAPPPPAAHAVQRPPGQGQSKGARKRANQAAVKAAAAAGGGMLALQNGGKGDGSKGKGKGKGNGACYAWNDGKDCPNNPCPYKHICSKCGGAHRRPECTQP